jgi:hypothetical protein
METTLFNRDGDAVAFITEDYYETIYLWDGNPVAYLHEDQHVYGINGRHLGWLVDEVIYTNNGERIGFTINSCPVSVAKEPIKGEKSMRDEIQSRWEAPAFPKLSFNLADRDLGDFLKEGQVYRSREEEPTEEPESP